MPDLAWTRITVRGKEEALRAFLSRHFVDREPSPSAGDAAGAGRLEAPWLKTPSSGESWIAGFSRKYLDFNTVLPEPADLPEGDLRAWRMEHWETKWNNGIEDSYLEHEPGELVFRVETAWDHPWPVLDALARMHPTLAFGFGCSLHDGLDGPDDCPLESFRPEEDEDREDEDDGDAGGEDRPAGA